MVTAIAQTGGEPVDELAEVQDYWEGYAERALQRGEDANPQAHFETLNRDHEIAYGFANQLLLRRVIEGKSVLELGCGMGFDTLALAKAGARVTAIDLSEKCLRLAQRHLDWYGVEAELRQGNAEALDLPEESFDVVVARGILMFTPSPSAVLSEILRVLRPGGRIQAILHHRYSWHVMLGAMTRTNPIDPVQDPRLSRLHTRAEVRALFSEFANVQIETDRFPTMTTRRSGLLPRLYDSAVVPCLKRVPRQILAPLGLYLIVEAIKPENARAQEVAGAVQDGAAQLV